MRLERKDIAWEDKMKIGFGTEEWDT